jgi:hypothetical protein
MVPHPRKTSAPEDVARKFNKFAANNVVASTTGSSNQMAGGGASAVRQSRPQPTHHKEASVELSGKDVITFGTSCKKCYM